MREETFVSDLITAKKAIETEVQGLKSLEDSLNTTFSEAVDLILKIEGRLIISGMGKSGHIASKMAATFASTGTPAFFLHPGEASHGDLGMVTSQDCVLVLSNSGETKELEDLVAFTRRFDIPMISMTQNPKSTLGRLSDVCLALPKAAEACPNGLAPTTSTTMMLVLGDALAVVALSRKGFSNEDFKTFHPGGQLGQRLRKVEDLMLKGEAIPLVSLHSLMKDVIPEMTGKSLGCTGVVNDKGCLVGVITDGDLRRHMSPDLLLQKAQDIMTPTPLSVPPDSLAAEAVKKMNKNRVSSFFIVDKEGVPVGIIHFHACLQAGIT